MPLFEQIRLVAVPLGLTLGGGVVLFGFAAATRTAPRPDPWDHVPRPPVPTDHGTFFEDDALSDGPSVTRACLRCHEGAAEQVRATAHWRWEGEPVVVPGHEGEPPLPIGKKNVINNFCIGIQGNWAGCTTCHAGYGWEDADFDFGRDDAVDCLVCHDRSGQYQKTKKGLPADGVDLKAAAGSVGRPTRADCGACHFAGGGGDAVKHGDLDGSMLNPNERVDVHMGRHGFVCVDCHQTTDHAIPGRSLSVSVDDAHRVRCTDCHPAAPHGDQRLDDHVRTVACQTCHIPSMGADLGTKTAWDWSTAGSADTERRVGDPHEYLAIKGTFTWSYGAAPEYGWYNGLADRYLLGEAIDPAGVTRIAGPLGDVGDDTATLWPFKVHRGRQPYDVGAARLIVPRTFGEGGYWHTFDWESAARLGAETTGLPFVGPVGFAPTEMYWPLSHMVQSADHALQCADCHGPCGRLDWTALGYRGDPARHGGRARQGLLP